MLIETVEGELDLKNDTTLRQSQAPESQVARLEMMLEVSRRLNATLDLESLLRDLIKLAIDLTNTEAAAVFLLDEKTETSQLSAVSGDRQGQPKTTHLSLNGSVASWIIKSGEPIVIHRIQEDERRFSEIDQLVDLELRMILGVPLVVKEKTIGVIEVFNKTEGAVFAGADIQALDMLATQAAVAVSNARRFKHSGQLVNVFHELRSPLTSIVGFSRLMLASSDLEADDFRAGLTSINREATRLSQIVNDFLDLTRIETGRVYMNREMVNFEVLAQEVIDLFYPQALEKRITLSLKVASPVPHLPADRDRLKQVLINLVDNAIKYSYQDGEVTLDLFCNEVRNQIAVTDTGRGIAPDELGLVFEKFYRVRNDDELIKGAGLGLALAKKIIEAHGGDIWVESEKGKGSTFHITLPVEPPEIVSSTSRTEESSLSDQEERCKDPLH